MRGGDRLSGSGLKHTRAASSLQVIEDLLDQHRGFDAGNDLDGAAAFRTGLNQEVRAAWDLFC